jgi:hypothetical protein
MGFHLYTGGSSDSSGEEEEREDHLGVVLVEIVSECVSE